MGWKWAWGITQFQPRSQTQEHSDLRLKSRLVSLTLFHLVKGGATKSRPQRISCSPSAVHEQFTLLIRLRKRQDPSPSFTQGTGMMRWWAGEESRQLLQALNSLERDIHCLLNEKVAYVKLTLMKVALSTCSLSCEKPFWNKHLYPNNVGILFSLLTCSYCPQYLHEICFIV